MRICVVVDMQNDFVTGALGTAEAQKIKDNVVRLVEERAAEGVEILFTLDCHSENYLETLEGKMLPVKHCIKGTKGFELIDELKKFVRDDLINIFDKPTFGSEELALYISSTTKRLEQGEQLVIEICGLCTDICVVSNALMLRAVSPNARIYVHEDCCAGTSIEAHKAALTVMKSCQIEVIKWEA